MHNYFSLKFKMLSLILSIILATIFARDSHEYTHIHIEIPNKFIAEYQKNVCKK